MKTLALLALAGTVVGVSPAQQDQAAARPASVYRIDFTLRDTEAGQKPNFRRYTLVSEEKEFARLRTGSRVPYSSSAGHFNYADIGTNINCRTVDRGGQVRIDYEVELSDAGRIDPETKNPLISQHKSSGSSTVTLATPTVISAWEEPGGKRKYEIEVTATKIAR